ncbi:hypothetical protein N7509_009800 [Penicillium cosmopolitanum]|uniref:CENP-V/GFA domain-containing protein n=1 Tax=Penicillium cosmopolitanum TaxID=1131564 RepID=A0A9X0B3Y0_9EURO|nr:uncharacterized protein N7509_009800 [Penicillium cosmopolitanum]KAJ5387259.1 hypothetical protein N7509_009800 [Penicillium cosmopolitanum]
MPTGSCLCHHLRYDDRTKIVISQATCFCLSCRKISGGTNSLNLLYPENKVHVIAGSAKRYSQIHESGMKLEITFCGECGCTIYKTHESFPGKIIILAGTLDNLDGLEESTPEQELFVKHRASWLTSLDGAEQKLEF